MDKFNFEQLMNIEVPGECIKKALEIPAVHKKTVFSVRFFRFAAGLAACMVIAAAVIFSAMFGVNKSVNLTNPGEEPHSAPSVGEAVPDSTGSANPTEASSKENAASVINDSSVTEPAEKGELVNEEKSAERPGETTGAEVKNNSKQIKENTKPIKENTKQGKENEKQSETSPEAPVENPEPSAEPETENIKFLDSDDWLIGAAPDDKPKPTRPNVSEAYGCSFLTSADKNSAEGSSYYCRIEDESGRLLGSGGLYSDSRKAQKYDWGNPNWPLDIRYTADFVMYYDHNYSVTFYNSGGDILWSGNVYLQQGKDDYLLY